METYEVREINNTVKFILPENVRIDITANDKVKKTIMTKHNKRIELLKINKKHFFHLKLRFTKPEHSKGAFF